MRLKRIRQWWGLWAFTSTLAIVPMLSDFMNHRTEISLQDLGLPFVLKLISATLLTAVLVRLLPRDRLAGLIASTLATLVLTNNFDPRLSDFYPLLRALNPVAGLGSFEGIIFSCVFAGIVVWAAIAIASWLAKVIERINVSRRDASGAILVSVIVMFGLQAIPAVRVLAAEWPQFWYRPPSLTAVPTSAKTAAKPDIYYIVLDRYASQDVLTSQFGFDNADFITFLKQNGYSINAQAHNNYPYTTMSIASTMTANYHNDIIKQFGASPEQTVIPYHATIRDSPVAQVLHSIGYVYSLVGNWYESSNTSYVADKVYQQDGIMKVFGHPITLDGFAKDQLTHSPFGRLLVLMTELKAPIQLSSQDGADMTDYQLQTLHQLASQPPGGRFVFAHILVPHDPYYFNADGSLSSNYQSDDTGQPIKQKYLGQVRYINGQMKSLLSQINQASNGTAVVVLQADEGPYPMQFNDGQFVSSAIDELLAGGDMRQWSDADLAMKFGNLAAYHVPAASEAEIETGGDSVNIFRLILNKYFDTTLAYLPRCYYGYPAGRSTAFNYVDLTQRLTGQPADSRCQSNGSVN